jgi:hypothetical protein
VGETQTGTDSLRAARLVWLGLLLVALVVMAVNTLRDTR